MNNCLIPADGRRVLLEALVICLLALAVGLSLNFRLILNVFSGQSPAAAPGAEQAEPARTQPVPDAFPVPVALDELDQLLDAGALLVDARNVQAYRAGHPAGAVSLPYAGEKTALDAFLAEVPRDRPLITYCSGYGCPDSFDLGMLLIDAGYRDVMVYEGGYPEWRDAGKPVVKDGP